MSSSSILVWQSKLSETGENFPRFLWKGMQLVDFSYSEYKLMMIYIIILFLPLVYILQNMKYCVNLKNTTLIYFQPSFLFYVQSFQIQAFLRLVTSIFDCFLPSAILPSVIFYPQSLYARLFYVQLFYLWSFYVGRFYVRSWFWWVGF